MLFCFISILFFIISNAQFTNLPNFDEKNLKFGYKKKGYNNVAFFFYDEID